MRVLHILRELKPSGAEVMLRVAGPVWQEMDIRSEILSTGEATGQYGTSLKKAGYTIHHLRFSRSILFLEHLYKFLRRNKYDVVHVHTEQANFWLALIALLAGRPRLVRTIHSVFAFRGWLRLKRGVQRRLLRVLGVVQVSVSPSVKATEWSYFRNPTVCILNWYDNEKFVPPTEEERRRLRANIGVEEDVLVVVSVGNCSTIKNHVVLLEALSLVSDNIDFLYLHIGDEEPGGDERELAEGLGIGDRVRFLGIVEDVAPLLSAADAYVMPSLWEGLPLSAVEAVAVGVPSVLAEVPGVKDLKGLSDNLYWTEPEPESIAAALLSLAKASEGSQTLPLRSTTLRKRYGVERGCEEYASLYKGRELKEGSKWGR